MKFKLFAVLALIFSTMVANAATNAVEICAKSRFAFKWSNAYKEDGLLSTDHYLNQEIFERQAVPAGNYVTFNNGTEDNIDIRILKLNRILTGDYQEVEDFKGEKWLVAKKMPNQICR